MRRKPTRLFLLTLLIIAVSGGVALGQDLPRAFHDSGPSLQGIAATPSQKAIFAPFAAATCVTAGCPRGQLNTALSISNTLAAPTAIDLEFEARFSDLEGTVEVYLWDSQGHMLFYETAADSPGIGLVRELGREGFLPPGQTWRVLLNQLLAEVDYEQHEIDFLHEERGVFAGYIWVVGNFDGIQGTTNLTDFATFTQSLVMQPDFGSTFFDFNADAGVPLIPPPDDDPGGN